MTEKTMSKQEKAFSEAVRESIHESIAIAMSIAVQQEKMDHGTALTIAHRECSLLALGLLGSLMTGQKDAEAANEFLFMAQTRYQLDMETMISSFEKVTGREIRREFLGSIHHA